MRNRKKATKFDFLIHSIKQSERKIHLSKESAIPIGIAVLGRITGQICLHFRHRRKLRFASVQPSAAALVRTAFDCSNPSIAKKKAHPFGRAFFLELLARFELATSSIPTILERFLPCVACRKLSAKTLVYQGLFGFACCPLL